MQTHHPFPDAKDFKIASRTLAELESKLAKVDAEQSKLNAELGKRKAELKTTEDQLDKAYGAFDEDAVAEIETALGKLKAGVVRYAKMLSGRGEAPGRAQLQQQIIRAQLVVRDCYREWWDAYETACREKALEWLARSCLAATRMGRADMHSYLDSKRVQDSLHAAMKACEEPDYPVPVALPFKVDRSMIKGPDREQERIAAREERAQQEPGSAHRRLHGVQLGAGKVS